MSISIEIFQQDILDKTKANKQIQDQSHLVSRFPNAFKKKLLAGNLISSWMCIQANSAYTTQQVISWVLKCMKYSKVKC